jgi:hypothetical protein
MKDIRLLQRSIRDEGQHAIYDFLDWNTQSKRQFFPVYYHSGIHNILLVYGLISAGDVLAVRLYIGTMLRILWLSHELMWL